MSCIISLKMRVKSYIEFLTKREKQNYYLQQHLACIVINFNNIAFALIQESGENKNNYMYRCMFRTAECILNSLTLCTVAAFKCSHDNARCWWLPFIGNI